MCHKVRSNWDNCSGIEQPMAEAIEPVSKFKSSGIGALNCGKSAYSMVMTSVVTVMVYWLFFISFYSFWDIIFQFFCQFCEPPYFLPINYIFMLMKLFYVTFCNL